MLATRRHPQSGYKFAQFPVTAWITLMLANTLFSLGIQADTTANELEGGQRIYQEGILTSGAPLKGVRLDSIPIEGAQAACSTCHRASGMGSVEGNIQVQPITGKFLFAQPEDKALATMDLRGHKNMNQAHAPYTDESLAKAITGGIKNSGQTMNAIMPRYALGTADMSALIAYLRQLSIQWPPGVTQTTIHFATVITPGVDAAKRMAMIEMLNLAFTQKNASTVDGAQYGGRRHMVTAAEMVLGTERKWQLHVWELQGDTETWAQQLDEKYRKEPVFAVVSGLSDNTWEPVNAFCEKERIPCWFPSIPLPPTKVGLYSVYFSRGVALEAEILARHLREKDGQRIQRLVQVYGDDYVSHGAALALQQALANSGIAVEDRRLGEVTEKAIQRSIASTTDRDALMFWLRTADVAKLDPGAPAPAATAYFSAELAGERAPIPAGWQATARLIYPYDLPAKRQDNLRTFHTWLDTRKIPLVDEPFQAEVFFALNSLTTIVGEMLDNLYRDYLLERAESMLGRDEAIKSEQQARELETWGTPHDRRTRHESTTVYPHLSLGAGQRFASKGGYIVHLQQGQWVAESEWIVP